MVSYLILCRSLTYAQRTARVLEQAGIGCHVMRTPKMIAGEGCGYSVKISERWLDKALVLLKANDLSPRQVYLQNGNRKFDEVAL